jgi:hypothetical protein
VEFASKALRVFSADLENIYVFMSRAYPSYDIVNDMLHQYFVRAVITKIYVRMEFTYKILMEHIVDNIIRWIRSGHENINVFKVGAENTKCFRCKLHCRKAHTALKLIQHGNKLNEDACITLPVLNYKK